MKILNVYGSYRYGSSATIADWFLDKAASLGAEIQNFELDLLRITRCTKCLSCKTVTDHCVIPDDINRIFDSLAQCDVLVLSTGIYNSRETGNLTILEQRLFSLLKPDYETNPDASRLPPGKKLVFIQSQAAAQNHYTDIHQRYASLFRTLGFGSIYIIHACHISEPEDLDSRDDLKKLAQQIAEDVMDDGTVMNDE